MPVQRHRRRPPRPRQVRRKATSNAATATSTASRTVRARTRGRMIFARAKTAPSRLTGGTTAKWSGWARFDTPPCVTCPTLAAAPACPSPSRGRECYPVGLIHRRPGAVRAPTLGRYMSRTSAPGRKCAPRYAGAAPAGTACGTGPAAHPGRATRHIDADPALDIVQLQRRHRLVAGAEKPRQGQLGRQRRTPEPPFSGAGSEWRPGLRRWRPCAAGAGSAGRRGSRSERCGSCPCS